MALYLKICLFTRNEFYLHVKFFIIRHFTGPFRILSFKKMQRCLVAFGLLALHSNEAAQQQFLKHIYWNFMESGFSEIEICLNLWVSASKELGKVLEEGSPVVIEKIVKRIPGQDKMGGEYEKNVLHKEEGQVLHLLKPPPPPPLSNDRFLINLLTGPDTLSTGWLKALFFIDFHPFW